MTESLRDMIEREFGVRPMGGEFKRCWMAIPGLDSVMYLIEDCMTVEQWIDPTLTVIWSADRSKIVGVRIEGLDTLQVAINEATPPAAP